MTRVKNNKLVLFTLVIICLFLFYPNDVFAKKKLATCSYSNSKQKSLSIYEFEIYDDYSLKNGNISFFKSDAINRKKSIDNWNNKSISSTGVVLSQTLKEQAKRKSNENICPTHIVIAYSKVLLKKSYFVYGFYSSEEAATAAKQLQLGKMTVDTIQYKKDLTEEKEITKPKKKKIDSCTKVLGSPKDSNSVAWLLQKLFNYVKVLGPILVILLSAIDFTKTILISDEEAMKKNQKRLGIRLACAVGIYFLPMIVTLIINITFGTVDASALCGIK